MSLFPSIPNRGRATPRTDPQAPAGDTGSFDPQEPTSPLQSVGPSKTVTISTGTAAITPDGRTALPCVVRGTSFAQGVQVSTVLAAAQRAHPIAIEEREKRRLLSDLAQAEFRVRLGSDPRKPPASPDLGRFPDTVPASIEDYLHPALKQAWATFDYGTRVAITRSILAAANHRDPSR